ncbi:hypothetical protein BDW62DRAFT_174633 [Aspergillus aurantiobrunneus]
MTHMAAKIRRCHGDYTVAWICALPIEMAAAKAMLDEIHDDLPVQSNDHNAYSLGSIWHYNVVIACLPHGKYGKVSASSVVAQLLSSFRSVGFGLMVGIGGAVPNGGADIRLGDIVVSKPTDRHGGVVQYDYERVLSGGNIQQNGTLSHPPRILLSALSKLRADHLNHSCRFLGFYAELGNKAPDRASIFARPTQKDHLYLSDYVHRGPDSQRCTGCDPSKTVFRPSRNHETPVVHYGLIGSADKLVRDSSLRDKLGERLGVYCLEMEAAGVMDSLPALVIRGICDYSDSHKNDEWQGYASAMAAAYAKELLLSTPVAISDQGLEFHVPSDLSAIPTVKDFIGREDELENLWHYLRPTTENSRKVTVLHGLGGMGKTHLAIQFAQLHKNDFTDILWLNGKNRETLNQSLSSAISRIPGQGQKITAMNEEETKRNTTQVLQWLAFPANNRWLLIFDNVEQYFPGTDDGYDVAHFFPPANHGSILITSRLLKLSELGESFPLEKLNPTHATQLLLQSMGYIHRGLEEAKTSKKVIRDLVDHLDGLPLAISLAGTYIGETGTSVSKYIQRYRESWHSLQSRTNPIRHYERGNILKTWLVSYDEIRNRDPEAAELLLFLAHFETRGIWFELLKHGAYCLDRPKWFDVVMSDELIFREKMRKLLEFSFIGIDESIDDSYTMHPVVRNWCLYMSDSQGETFSSRLKELALISLGYMVPDKNKINSYLLRIRLGSHATWLLSRLNISLQANNIVVCNAFRRIGDLFTGLSRLEEAEYAYKWGIYICQKMGLDDQTYFAMFQLFHGLAILYDVTGRIRDAEENYQLAISGFQHMNVDQAFTVEAMNNYGNLYIRYNMPHDAEKAFQDAWSTGLGTLPSDHRCMLDALDNLGVVHMSFGRIEEAEATFRKALDGKMKAFGPDDLSTLDSFTNMARISCIQGKFEEAKTLYDRSLLGRRNILGLGRSPGVYYTLYEMVCLCVRQSSGYSDCANQMFSEALSGLWANLGPDHPHTVSVMYDYGDFLLHTSRPSEAQSFYRSMLSGYKEILSPDHPLILQVTQKLGTLNELKDPDPVFFPIPKEVMRRMRIKRIWSQFCKPWSILRSKLCLRR